MTGNELIQHCNGQKVAVVFTGIPASGKSTFYRRYFEPADFQHINLDTLRTRQRETAFMEECVSLNCNVVIDNTNTTVEERKRYIDLFKANGYRIVGMYFQSILKDCIARNKARGGKVPRVAIPYMHNRLVIPSYAEGFDELYFVKFDGNGDFVIENWIE
ncbi:MAG: ATP-binding protein [Bacteroidales bacterium]|nr:ATP-binding protein [Bacteroidales bacterium]